MRRVRRRFRLRQQRPAAGAQAHAGARAGGEPGLGAGVVGGGILLAGKLRAQPPERCLGLRGGRLRGFPRRHVAVFDLLDDVRERGGVFEEILGGYKEEHDLRLDTEMTAENWEEIVRRYKKAVERELGKPFPGDVNEQLWGAVGAVFKSWMNDRAKTYRRMYDIPESWGTAVNVQAMVFGNMGETSATGVAFTRDPSTGAKRFYGEYLINAQGEDVVAGIRTPSPIAQLERENPALYRQFADICQTLETHYRDTMDVEFTFEKGRLYFLQCRVGKRTTRAAVKIAHDMVREGLIDKREALQRVQPQKLDDLLHDRRMTLTELAERVGMTLPNLSILKTGKARAIRFSTLDAICEALSCQPGDLLRFEPQAAGRRSASR